MPTYISLAKFTDDGLKNIKASPARLDAAKAAFKAAGGEMKQFYLVMGRYDMVVISELPNDEAALKVDLAISARGALVSEGLRAFTEAEYRKLMAELP